MQRPTAMAAAFPIMKSQKLPARRMPGRTPAAVGANSAAMSQMSRAARIMHPVQRIVQMILAAANPVSAMGTEDECRGGIEIAGLYIAVDGGFGWILPAFSVVDGEDVVLTVRVAMLEEGSGA